jgi:hypothetical protein
MTFLKKLGQILVNVAGVAAGFGPLVAPFLGSGKSAQVVATATNDLTAIAQRAVEIETAFAAVPGSTGAQKLAALIPLVGNIIATSELVSGKKIGNTDQYQKAISGYAQATVDLLNAIHPDEAKHG